MVFRRAPYMALAMEKKPKEASSTSSWFLGADLPCVERTHTSALCIAFFSLPRVHPWLQHSQEILLFLL